MTGYTHPEAVFAAPGGVKIDPYDPSLSARTDDPHRTAAPDITLTRAHNGAPETPDVAVPGPSGVLGRPGSEIRSTYAYHHESGPESPRA